MNKYSSMKFIHNTISLCNTCYRHVPGVVYEKDNKILLTKQCEIHGEMTEIVEIDCDFFYNLEKTSLGKFLTLMFETTNKCQLNCPHCYQLPDNKSVDKPLELILSKIDDYPRGFIPMIAGAEPTLYKEIVPLAHTLVDRYGRTRLLTNGLKFYDKKFAKKLLSGGGVFPAVGLNHWSYQGKKIHQQQLAAIENIKEFTSLDDIGYTVESYDHLPEIFEEVSNIASDKVNMVRIRFGSFIGRSSDENRNYLSKTVKRIKEILGDELIPAALDDNPYHVMFKWRGISLRIIQWPDVKNIDMEELNTGPWANFQDGPITNFVHQVILRDAFINNKLKRYDFCPEYYHIKNGTQLDDPNYAYWKTDWSGPVEFDKFDYNIVDKRKKPKKIL